RYHSRARARARLSIRLGPHPATRIKRGRHLGVHRSADRIPDHTTDCAIARPGGPELLRSDLLARGFRARTLHHGAKDDASSEGAVGTNRRFARPAGVVAGVARFLV